MTEIVSTAVSLGHGNQNKIFPVSAKNALPDSQRRDGGDSGGGGNSERSGVKGYDRCAGHEKTESVHGFNLLFIRIGTYVLLSV